MRTQEIERLNETLKKIETILEPEKIKLSVNEISACSDRDGRENGYKSFTFNCHLMFPESKKSEQ